MRTLWKSTSVSGRTVQGTSTTRFDLISGESANNWEYIQIIGRNLMHSGHRGWGMATVPSRNLGTSEATSLYTAIHADRGDKNVFGFKVWKSSDGETIYIKGQDSNEWAQINNISGLTDASAGSGDDAGTLPAAPPAPTVSGGARQIAVTITAPTNTSGTIHGYDLRHKLSSAANTLASWTEKALRNRETTGTITGLADATSYDVQVRARHSAGDTAWSASASATTNDAADPPVPGAPSVTSVTGGSQQVSVSWSPPSSNGGAAITHYRWRRRTGSGSWTEGPDLAASPTSATISSLKASTSYQVQVRAKNSAGWGPWSRSRTGTTTAAIPRVPGDSGVPRVVGGNWRVFVSWTAPSSNGGAAITHYQLRHRTGSRSWTTGSDLAASSTSKTITGLAASTSYQVQVRAKNSAGYGPWSPPGTGTTDAPPPPPPPLKPPPKPRKPTVASGDRRLNVTWSAVSRATEYRVRYREKDTSPWTTDSTWVSTRARTITTRITNGTEYEIQLQAKNSGGESPWSDTTPGTPRDPIKFQGTLTVGGSSAYGGYNAQLGSLTKTAGTLTITSLVQIRGVRVERTTLTLSGSPANSDSTFSTLTIGSTAFRRSDATYSNGSWRWIYTGGFPAVGSTVTVTLK